MKIFKLIPVLIPNIVNTKEASKIVGISAKIVSGEVGDTTTPHTYYLGFHREITEEIDGETTTRLEEFHGTNLTITQAETVAVMNPETQYTVVQALAKQYGYELLPENQQ